MTDEDEPAAHSRRSLFEWFFDRFGGEWLTGTPRGQLPIYKQPPDSPAVQAWTPPPPRSPRMQKAADTEERLTRGCFPWLGLAATAVAVVALLVGLIQGDLTLIGVSAVMVVMWAAFSRILFRLRRLPTGDEPG